MTTLAPRTENWISSAAVSKERLIAPSWGPQSPTISSGDPRSDALRAAGRRLAQLVALDDDWDSYGGHPLAPEIARRGWWVIHELSRFGVPVPDVIPTSDGGLQLEWQQASLDLEITFQPDEQPTVFFLDRSTREFAEKPLAATGVIFDILNFFGATDPPPS